MLLNPETVKGFAEAHYKPFLRDHKKIQYADVDMFRVFERSMVTSCRIAAFEMNPASVATDLRVKSFIDKSCLESKLIGNRRKVKGIDR